MRCITSLDRYFCQIARVNWTEFLSSWSQMKLKMIISGTEFVERDLLIFLKKVNWTEFLSSWSQMKLKMIISGTEFVERDLLIFLKKEGDNELKGAFY